MPTFHIKEGDLAPPLEVVLRDGEGEPVDLSGIGSVAFHLAPRYGAPAEPFIDEPAVVDGDGSAGLVRYDWQEGDTDTPGVYSAEFEVTSAGIPTTFPNTSDIVVHIHRSIA